MKTNPYTVRDFAFQVDESRDTGDGRTLSGYAAVFDQDAEIKSYEGKFIERIKFGAFKRTLGIHNPIMQYDHGRDVRVGTVPIGVYSELREDEHGLFVEGRLLDNPVVEPIRQAIEAHAITGMSFKFRVLADYWTDKVGRRLSEYEMQRLVSSPGSRGPIHRTITEIALHEAGPVASPAYRGTSVGVRSSAESPRISKAMAERRLKLLGR
ncbi:HK97 family phage prohead protease [Rhodococcus sp. IEGM 1351]|uniref:HK97 family phage prohead protease n=1 Tax=Rhodococcus sp. IEGM 1351 TaxID=3047089 RepID=UPI0024B71870|nr:HK97 family phage prohead protease [Rhodococcus sp. IEGM 1351]MDI9936586.1 HK97 family phage prohead protease [Rhodococcus sp. IEGM 1351]